MWQSQTDAGSRVSATRRSRVRCRLRPSCWPVAGRITKLAIWRCNRRSRRRWKPRASRDSRTAWPRPTRPPRKPSSRSAWPCSRPCATSPSGRRNTFAGWKGKRYGWPCLSPAKFFTAKRRSIPCCWRESYGSHSIRCRRAASWCCGPHPNRPAVGPSSAPRTWPPSRTSKWCPTAAWKAANVCCRRTPAAPRSAWTPNYGRSRAAS